MIVIVLGMHKSGTSLVARTLHESGIDMGVRQTGEYPKCKYEDGRAQEIKNNILYNGKISKSYQLPWSYNNCRNEIRHYIEMRKAESSDWGFKIPDITLCYEMWKSELPEHICIGVRRNLSGVLAHYKKRQGFNIGIIKFVWHIYNLMIQSYDIPVVRYEEIMDIGPEVIEKIVGIPLKDVRHGRQK